MAGRVLLRIHGRLGSAKAKPVLISFDFAGAFPSVA